MLGKTRHLYNGNVRIFPRVMPVGCFHLLFLTVNVLANGNGDPCPHVHNGNYEQRISLLRSKNHSHPDASSVSPKGQTHEGVSTSQSIPVNQSVNSGHSSHTVEVKRSKSIHSVIGLILLIRFTQSRIWSIDTSTTTREPSSIRLTVRIWARSRQSPYSVTLLVCVIIWSCWRKYISYNTVNHGVILFQPPLLS